jgi:hypothetical protein
MKPQVVIAIAIAVAFADAKKACAEDDMQIPTCMMEDLSDKDFKVLTSEDPSEADVAKVMCDNKDILINCLETSGLFYLCSNADPNPNPRFTPNSNPNS